MNKSSQNINDHQTFSYIDPETKQYVYRPKKSYETDKEAIHAAMVMNVILFIKDMPINVVYVKSGI